MADIIANSTSGSVDNNFIPANTGSFLRADSLLWKKIFLQANEMDFLTFSEANELWMVSDDDIIRWHEDGWITNNIQVGSFTGGASPGANAVITISAADYQDSGTRSPFAANLTVKMDNTDMFIVSKNSATPYAHTLIVQPIGASANVTLNTVIAVGKTVIPIGMQFAEGTYYSEGNANIPVLREENLSIVKSIFTATGTAATQKQKTPQAYTGSLYIPDEYDRKTFIQHKEEISYLALIGAGGTATDAATNPLNIVKGVIPQVIERGNYYPYNTTLTLEDIYNFTKILARERAGNEQDMKVGIESNNMLEKLITDVMKQGARIYLDNANGTRAKGIKMVDFGYDGFAVGGYMFYKRPAVEFNHPKITMAAGQPYPWCALITPIAMTKDKLTGAAMYTTQIGYKAAPGPHGINFDRKFQLRIGGDSSTTPDSQKDEINYRYLTEFGVAVACANQGIFVSRANL